MEREKEWGSGRGLRFGTKMIMTISRSRRKISRLYFYRSTEKDYPSSHGKCHRIRNANQEPLTCADLVV